MVMMYTSAAEMNTNCLELAATMECDSNLPYAGTHPDFKRLCHELKAADQIVVFMVEVC